MQLGDGKDHRTLGAYTRAPVPECPVCRGLACVAYRALLEGDVELAEAIEHHVDVIVRKTASGDKSVDEDVRRLSELVRAHASKVGRYLRECESLVRT